MKKPLKMVLVYVSQRQGNCNADGRLCGAKDQRTPGCNSIVYRFWTACIFPDADIFVTIFKLPQSPVRLVSIFRPSGDCHCYYCNAAHLFGREVLKDYRDIFITITSAVLLFMGVSPFLVIAGTALTGIVVFRNIQRTEYRCTRTVGSFHVKQIVILLILAITPFFDR
jgi:hypothetical protein